VSRRSIAETEGRIAMKKGLMIGLGVVGALVAIIVVVLVVVVGSIDSIVKTAIETVGSEATQTKVSVNQVEISTREGRGSIRGLTLANPAGYKTQQAIALGDATVVIDLSTLTSGTIVIKQVTIAAPQVTYELGDGGSNIEVIRKNVEAFAGKMGGGSGGPGASRDAKPAAKKDEKKIVIENLVIQDGKVGVSAALLQGRTLSVPLPEIRLRDIGKDKGGASPAEITEKLLAEITNASTRAVAASADVRNLIGDRLPAARQLLDRAGEGAGGAIRNLLPGQQQQRR
jgi:hypothetical protein